MVSHRGGGVTEVALLFSLLLLLLLLLCVWTSSVLCLDDSDRAVDVGVATMYVDDSWSGVGSHYKFNTADVERFLSRAKELHLRPHSAPLKLSPFIEALGSISQWLSKSSSVLVLGSQEPWYESLLLAWGAGSVVTMEYNNLTYSHPQLTTVTPRAFLSSEGGGEYFGPRKFDVVVAAAAVDHDGLGRYGDPLAPDGDLLTMDYLKERLREATERRARLGGTEKDESASEGGGGGGGGGVLILTAPIGPDLVVWNLERRYGEVRLPLLLEGWDALGRFGYIEEKLRMEANFRQRFEPAWVLTPTQANAKSTHEDL